jgi:hypothetical protein
MLIVYIIHSAFGDVMLNHNLQLDVGCNFNYAIKAILVVNIDYNCFIIAYQHFSSSDRYFSCMYCLHNFNSTHISTIQNIFFGKTSTSSITKNKEGARKSPNCIKHQCLVSFGMGRNKIGIVK